MNDETKAEFSADMAAICKKYDILISGSASAHDDSGLEYWIEITRLIQRPGKYPREETLFKCDGFDSLGIASY